MSASFVAEEERAGLRIRLLFCAPERMSRLG